MMRYISLPVGLLGSVYAAITPEAFSLLPIFVVLFLLGALAFAAQRYCAGQRKNFVVIDGSNVMHWKDGQPSIHTVQEVINYLKEQGYTPGVMFDANAGYLLSDRYRHDGYFANKLGLPRDQIMVVPKGTPADPMILTFARDTDAKVVSNDQFRDWVSEFPEVKEPGHLLKGGYKRNKLWVQSPQITP